MDDRLVFTIEEWLGADGGDDADRLTTAALRIALGDESITRLEDLSAKTVRQTARVSAYRLAYWLAGNWWRLRWEPEPTSPRADWDMSHRLPAAGGGYIWPNLRFASDGVAVQVSSRVTRVSAGLSPVRLGSQAVDELAAAATHEGVLPVLEATLAARTEASRAPDIRFDADARGALRRQLDHRGAGDWQPWQIGESLATRARQLWGLGSGPIDNARPGGIVGAPARLFDGSGSDAPPGPPLPTVLDAAAFRNSRRPERFNIAIRSPIPENRRFHFARLLIDQAIADDAERLLPVATARTSRQKLQRAFAAQLLCPYDDLRAMLPATIEPDDIDGAAKRFAVSPRLVESMLVNKGDLDRASLSPI